MRPLFVALLVAYTLEGAGYIVAGTYLVAAVSTPRADGTDPWAAGVWVLVGLAAVPSSVLADRLCRRFDRTAVLLGLLVLQAVGIALPVVLPTLVSGADAVAAAAAAVLFGRTFMAVVATAMAVGSDDLAHPRAVAVLTTGYSAGQVLGPLAVTPLLDDGYRGALLAAAGMVALAALVTAALHHRRPGRRPTSTRRP